MLSRAVELLLDVTSPANGSKLSMSPLTCLCMENLIKWLHWSVTLEGVLMGVSHIWQSTLFYGQISAMFARMKTPNLILSSIQPP